LRSLLPGILEDPDNKLSGALRVLLTQLRVGDAISARQIGETDKLIARICGELEQCRRLVAIPGIGPITATATVAAIGKRCSFQEGPWILCLAGSGARRALHRRQAKADRYQQTRKQIPAQTLRTGAHTVLLQKTKQSSGLSTWLVNLTSRKRPQVATVALANKMARIAWAVCSKERLIARRQHHK